MSGYPDDDEPGYREGFNSDTSREAAHIVAPGAKAMAARVYDLIAEQPGTPEELTERMIRAGETALLNSVRARTTGLNKQGKIRPTGTFGKGQTGKVRTIRWRVATPDEIAAFERIKTMVGGAR